MTPPPAYSLSQVSDYLQHICLPEKFLLRSKPALDLSYLTALHIHHIATVPYENLLLHYSDARVVSIDPQAIYKKIVTQNGRGGYCMESSIFFHHILRALGFRVYTAGVRIRARIDGIPQGNYVGWVHIVNVVTLPTGERYMVDVAFGGDGATKPIPLIHGVVTHNLGTQDIRLVYESLEEFSDPDQRVWIYQYRNGPEKPWNSFYAFPEAEFLHSDFEIMNYWTSQCRDCFQTATILLVKFERKEDQIVGKVMMVNDTVKRNMGGKTEVVKVCKNEQERVEAIKEYFGLTLTEDEIKAIKGHPTELRSIEPMQMLEL